MTKYFQYYTKCTQILDTTLQLKKIKENIQKFEETFPGVDVFVSFSNYDTYIVFSGFWCVARELDGSYKGSLIKHGIDYIILDSSQPFDQKIGYTTEHWTPVPKAYDVSQIIGF